MKGLKRGQKGFTLFEVLIVVAILGVLAAIAAPIVSHFSVYGTVNAANTEADNVRTAASAYMVEHGGQWPASSEIEGVGSYLSGEPKAVYHFSNGEDGIKAGLIASAIPTESGWKDVQWDVTSQMWVAIGKPVVGLGDGVAVKGGGSSGGSEGGTGPELAQIEPTTYTLTVYIVGNGSVEPPLGSYEPGTEVQLTVT